MPIDRSFIGVVQPPTSPHEVTAAHVDAFATAIGSVAGRETAPPTFPIALSMPAEDQVLKNPAFGLDHAYVVHRDQEFDAVRPIRVGDRLVVAVTVLSAERMSGNDVVCTRAEIATVDGEAVCTATSTMVSRAAPGRAG